MPAGGAGPGRVPDPVPLISLAAKGRHPTRRRDWRRARPRRLRLETSLVG